MKYLFCLLTLFAGYNSYSQSYDYMKEPGSMYSNFPDPFYLLPFELPHDSCCTKSLRTQFFNEHISLMHHNPEYYLNKAREMDFKYILLRIVDRDYKYRYFDELISMCDLQRDLDKKLKEEKIALKAQEKFVDSIVKSPELLVIDDRLNYDVPLYKIIQAVAKYHKLKLELKDPLSYYMLKYDITMNIKDLHRVLCVIHENTGLCFTPIDNRLVVQRKNPNECKCNCDD